jgi:vanillate O-demethylase ferredoxin subunit
MTMSMLKVRVASKAQETADICTLELTAVEGAALPAFSAGAHVDVHLPNGLVRQYSLCNNPSETQRYVIAVLKDQASRGGSRAVHEAVAQGDELTISMPRNLFGLADSAQHSILLAGGIGVTPILSMAHALQDQQKPFEMHYCAKSKESAAFQQHLGASALSSNVHFHYSNEQRADLAQLLARPDAHTHLYACGPARFMDAVLQTAQTLGWAKENVHYEYFGATHVAVSGDADFDIKIKSTGQVIRITPDCSVTQALSDAGIEVPVSCEQGVCGTCLTNVLEGEPDHRDMYLSPQEQAKNDCFLPCCSRSRTATLVLDL